MPEHAQSLRTSTAGHPLEGTRSFLSWFLAQHGTVKGFTRAVFSAAKDRVYRKLLVNLLRLVHTLS